MFMDLSDINTKDASWTECKKSVTLELESEWTWNILHYNLFSQHSPIYNLKIQVKISVDFSSG